MRPEFTSALLTGLISPDGRCFAPRDPRGRTRAQNAPLTFSSVRHSACRDPKKDHEQVLDNVVHGGLGIVALLNHSNMKGV
jgi:hypothetical protein